MARGKNVFGNPKIYAPGGIEPPASMNDLFLHALFARLALGNGENVEFSTQYDPATNEIELEVPPNALEFFDQITGIQRGERFKTFINWLIGSDVLVPTLVLLFDQDPNFISVSKLSVWVGATQGNLEGKQLILYLPTSELAVVGHNTKIDESFEVGSMKVYMVWVFDTGVNASFDIKTDIKLTDIASGSTLEASNSVNISTFNLLKGDIRETELIEIDNIEGNDLVNMVISRNYDGSPDAQSELVGIVGLRIELIG